MNIVIMKTSVNHLYDKKTCRWINPKHIGIHKFIKFIIQTSLKINIISF